MFSNKFKTQCLGLAADMDSEEERIVGEMKDRSEVITLPAAQKDRKKP